MLSLAPAAAALVGVVLIAVGSGAVRDLGIALLAAYAALVLLSMGLAAVRFRSLQVGLLAIPALIATQAVYVAGFVRGGLQNHD